MTALPNIAGYDFFAQARERVEQRAAQARAALAELRLNPPCPRGLFAYEWSADIGEPITCYLEYEEGEESQPYGDAPYPGAPERITLCHAYLRGVDILSLLSESQIETIEILAGEERTE